MPAEVGAVSKVGETAINTKTGLLMQSYLQAKAVTLKYPLVALGVASALLSKYFFSVQMAYNDRGDAVTSLQVAMNVAIKNKDTAGTAELNQMVQDSNTLVSKLLPLLGKTGYTIFAINKVDKAAKSAEIMSRGAKVVEEINSKILVIGSSIQEAVMAKDQLGQPNWSVTAPTEQTFPEAEETQFMKDTKERLRLQEESKARENAAYLEGVKAQLEMKMEYNAMINAAYYEAQKANDLERAKMYEDRLEKSYAQQQKILDFWDDYQDQKAQDQADYFDLKYAEWVKEQEYYKKQKEESGRSTLNFGLLR
jgi:hypothetical protein